MTLQEIPQSDNTSHNRLEKVQNDELIKKIRPVRLRIMVVIKKNMNLNMKTRPEDICKECGIRRAKDATDYIRDIEKEGLVNVKREKNLYIDIKLTEKGIHYLNNHLLIPYKKEVREKILKIESNGTPEVFFDEDLKNFAKIFAPKISSCVLNLIQNEYNTTILDNNSEKISQEILKFFNQEIEQFNKNNRQNTHVIV